MSWAIGYDVNWQRDIGYGVPSRCDHPDCEQIIDRGLGYVCGSDPYGGERGCGLFFCGNHLLASCICQRCKRSKVPFDPKPDLRAWMLHKLFDESWKRWRGENPTEVHALYIALNIKLEDPMSIFQLGHLRIQFAAIEKPLENQIRDCGFTIDAYSSGILQSLEDSVRKLRAHGILTEGEAHAARRRLVKQARFVVDHQPNGLLALEVKRRKK